MNLFLHLEGYEMMGGSRKQRGLLDLLNNPDALKSTLANHKQAVDAHARAAEDYRKKKADALKVIEELTKKQALHDETEARLEARQKTLDDLSGKLNAQIADYNFKHKEVDDFKAELERQKVDQHQILQRMTNDVLAKDQEANQKQLHLEQQLMSAAQKHEEISRRESLVLQRETEIVEFADRLRGR